VTVDCRNGRLGPYASTTGRSTAAPALSSTASASTNCRTQGRVSVSIPSARTSAPPTAAAAERTATCPEKESVDLLLEDHDAGAPSTQDVSVAQAPRLAPGEGAQRNFFSPRQALCQKKILCQAPPRGPRGSDATRKPEDDATSVSVRGLLRSLRRVLEELAAAGWAIANNRSLFIDANVTRNNN
jgi:hypothetical protein